MVGTIGPVVYGQEKSSKRILIVGAYFVAQVGAGALTGFLFSTLGSALQVLHPLGVRGTAVAIAAFSLIGALRELGILPIPLPSTGLQVPRAWMALPPVVMAFCYV